MKTIGEELNKIGSNLKDMRSVVERAAEPVRDYERHKPAKMEKPKRARFKLYIRKFDNTPKTFFSFDLILKPDKTYQLDEWSGLFKLTRLLHDFTKQAKVIIIYATLDKYPDTNLHNYDVEVAIFKKGKLIQNPYVSFNPVTNELNTEILKLRQEEKRKEKLQKQKPNLNRINQKNRKS